MLQPSISFLSFLFSFLLLLLHLIPKCQRFPVGFREHVIYRRLLLFFLRRLGPFINIRFLIAFPDPLRLQLLHDLSEQVVWRSDPDQLWIFVQFPLDPVGVFYDTLSQETIHCRILKFLLNVWLRRKLCDFLPSVLSFLFCFFSHSLQSLLDFFLLTGKL